jgi:hypothetical protein
MVAAHTMVGAEKDTFCCPYIHIYIFIHIFIRIFVNIFIHMHTTCCQDWRWDEKTTLIHSVSFIFTTFTSN